MLPGLRRKTKELHPLFNRFKFQKHPWMKELSCLSPRGGCIDAEDAIKRFYKGEADAPKYHGKESRKRFMASNGVGTVRIENDLLVLPKKMGRKVKMKHGLRWNKTIRECRISQRGGRWFASLRVEISKEEYGIQCGDGAVAIDLGLKNFAVITGEKPVVAPQPMKRSLKRLARAQRVHARRLKGSNRRKKAKCRVNRIHYRIGNLRKDFLHQLSHRLTRDNKEIVIESLSLKSWQKRWGRKASDLAPAEFVRQLKYKTDWRGGVLTMVDRHFPSTQMCSECGEITGKKPLEIRSWQCSFCGANHDRDRNAEKNLLTQRTTASSVGSYARGDCDEQSSKREEGR